MVFFSIVSETETQPSMETKKPRPLHNHNFFFPGLGWSKQQILPRMEFDPKTKIASSSSPIPPLCYPQPYPSLTRNQDHLLHAIPSEVCKKPVSIIETSSANGKEEALAPGSSPRYLPITQQNQVKHSRRAAVAAAKREQQKFNVSLTKEEIEEDLFAMKGLKPPWRPKKRPKVFDHLLHAIPSEVCKKSVSIKETSSANGKEEALAPGSSSRYLPMITQQNQVKHSHRATVAAAKREQQKFSVSLTKEEIEEDLFALKGLKPPWRPKKRPKVVKQQFDGIFPGLGFPARITQDRYRVAGCYDSEKR